jgi:hypothetical protein
VCAKVLKGPEITELKQVTTSSSRSTTLSSTIIFMIVALGPSQDAGAVIAFCVCHDFLGATIAVMRKSEMMVRITFGGWAPMV